MGIPAAYFKRCPPELQDVQFNYWVKRLENGSEVGDGESRARNGAGNGAPNGKSHGSQHAQPERWLLRAKGSHLRAVLSDQYCRMDNAPLLRCLAPVLDSRFQVGGFNLTEETMHLRVLDPTRVREVLPDDRVMVGVHIANSEVGKRAVTIDALVYRLVCRNGLIRLVKGKSLLYRRHVFRSSEQLQRAVQQVMGAVLDAADVLAKLLSWATQQPIKDVDETLKHLSERWGLTQEFQEQVRKTWLDEPPSQHETLYGLVNAFTHAAQRLPADDRYRVEVLAGQLVEHGLRQRSGHRYPVSQVALAA